MHSILAIAKVTLKDALRKKVLFTILVFAVILTASGYLPSSVRPEDHLRQMVKVCLSAIGFFGMIIAIFLSAPSLPEDISKKTIFTVMTKPARRWQILAGKILGLGFVLAILLGVMGALAFVYVNFWTWKLVKENPGMPRLQGHKAHYAESIDYHGLTLEVSEPMLESARAIASGFDSITFHVTGLGGERFEGDKVLARVVLHKHGEAFDPKTDEGTLAILVTNPTTREGERIVFGAESLKPEYKAFDGSLIDAEGRVDITVLKNLPSGSYSAMAKSVAVLSQPAGFTLNFLKALVLMFMQYMLLVFIAVAASTVLTSTVSTIFALFVFFTGSLAEILRAQAMTLGSGANIATMGQHSHGGGEVQMTAVQWVVNMVLRYFYLGIGVVFPNLSAFDPSEHVAGNEFISAQMLVNGLLYGGIYAGVAFLVAWVIFRRKEIA